MGEILRKFIDAIRLRGRRIEEGQPLEGEILVYRDGPNEWRYETPGGGGGQANTASNVNVGGVGVFKQKVGVDLEFKGINAGSSKVTVTEDGPNNEIDIDIVESEISHDALADVDVDEHRKFKFNITPSGSVNGTNVTFTLPDTPANGVIALFLNGQMLDPGAGEDYTLSGAVITMLDPPKGGPGNPDKLRTMYQV